MRHTTTTPYVTTKALALAAALAVAAPCAAQAASRDYAVGTGTNQIGRVSFAAHGGPSPFEPVTGHFTAKGRLAEIGGAPVGEFKFLGPVTCLTVVGNRAGLFYPIENADPSTFEGSGVFITLEDNGNPASGEAPDRIGFLGPVPAPENPILCPPGPTPVALEHGNVTIRDVP